MTKKTLIEKLKFYTALGFFSGKTDISALADEIVSKSEEGFLGPIQEYEPGFHEKYLLDLYILSFDESRSIVFKDIENKMVPFNNPSDLELVNKLKYSDVLLELNKLLPEDKKFSDVQQDVISASQDLGKVIGKYGEKIFSFDFIADGRVLSLDIFYELNYYLKDESFKFIACIDRYLSGAIVVLLTNEQIKKINEYLGLRIDVPSNAWIELMDRWIEVERYDEVKDYLKYIKDKEPKPETIDYIEERLYTGTKEYDKQIEVFKRIVQRDPSQKRYYQSMGYLYMNGLNDYEKAVESFSQYLEVEPAPVMHTYIALADCYTKLKNYEKEAEIIEKAIESNSDVAYLYNHLGNIYLHDIRDNEHALKIFENAFIFAQTPEERSTLKSNQAKCLLRMKRLKEAAQIYAEAVRFNPKNSIALYDHACTLSILDRKQEAIENLKKAIEIDPSFRESSKTDTDFENVKEMEEFKEIISKTV